MYKVINLYNDKLVLMGQLKERLSVEVDKDVLRQFKGIVIRKHGKLRGNMTTEVAEALKLYVEKFRKEE